MNEHFTTVADCLASIDRLASFSVPLALADAVEARLPAPWIRNHLAEPALAEYPVVFFKHPRRTEIFKQLMDSKPIAPEADAYMAAELGPGWRELVH